MKLRLPFQKDSPQEPAQPIDLRPIMAAARRPRLVPVLPNEGLAFLRLVRAEEGLNQFRLRDGQGQA